MGKAVEQSKEQLKETSANTEAEDLGRLLGVIAHEIKNPLSTIKVNLKLIDEELQSLQDQPIARARRKLSIIDKETARLEQILDGFLRYADRSKPNFADMDLNAIIDDMFDFYRPQATAHSVMMRQCLSKEPLICPADSGMFKQAILNLFINAIQAIGASGELIVQTSRDGQFAKIQISDTGKGIPAERLEHLFEPYQSSRPDGTGLGLATVKKIIDAHNAKISVVSEPGKGTAFTISMPLSENKK